MLLDPEYQEISSAEIRNGSTSASVTAGPGQPCYVAVWLYNEEKATLCKIDFEVIDEMLSGV